MYQPQIGDRIKFTGYTPEAYRNGSVPTFMIGEGIVIEIDHKLYLKLDSEWIIPLYYLDNIQLIFSVKKLYKCLECETMLESSNSLCETCFQKYKSERVVEQDLTPEEEYYYSMDGSSISEKCNGCDAWIDDTGTPAHCAVETCPKESEKRIEKTRPIRRT